MKILHTMLRVNNLDESIDFYQNVLGMHLLKKEDYPEGKFTLAFIGYGNEKENSVLELTYNWEISNYNLGNAFGHIAIEVENAKQACKQAKKKGAEVVREAGPMQHGKTVIAFLKDPNGYLIEFIEKS